MSRPLNHGESYAHWRILDKLHCASKPLDGLLDQPSDAKKRKLIRIL
jgi:hypothetical protein